jgi:hypothetical protein
MGRGDSRTGDQGAGCRPRDIHIEGAHQLSWKALEVLRDLWDETGSEGPRRTIRIVMVGNDGFRQKIANRLPQLADRAAELKFHRAYRLSVLAINWPGSPRGETFRSRCHLQVMEGIWFAANGGEAGS